MSKDGPASGLIGFGFQQAKEAGAPHFVGRSNSALNLERLLKERPHLRAKAAALVKSGTRVDAVLGVLRDLGLAGSYYVEFLRGENRDEWAAEEWSDDEAALRGRIDTDLGLGIYKAAKLWYRNPETGGAWVIIEAFPAGQNSN